MDHKHRNISMMKEFELFTNSSVMRSIFQERLPGFAQGPLAVIGCRVLRTRYKTYADERTRHRSFLNVHYELEIAGAGGEEIAYQQFYARAYLNGRSNLKYNQIDAPWLCQPQFGEALAHWPDLGLIVWAFPNDPQLITLAATVDGEQVRAHLPYASLPPGFNRPADIASVGVEVVRYKPEVRCTIRYRLHSNKPPAGRELTLYGKTYASARGKEIYRYIETLWRESVNGAHHFLVAQPLGYDETLHMVWQEAVPGVALSSVLTAANDDHYLSLAARGLASLHQSALAPPHRITTAALLAEVSESTAELVAALPDLAGRLQRLLAGLEHDEPHLPPYRETLIHRDFHIKQLLVHEHGLAIFDFDDLASGDPLQDIAFFLVDCHFRDFDDALVAQMASAFCRAYQSGAREQLPLDRLSWHMRLNWHMRLQFLAKAHWYYKKKQLSPKLKAHILRILDLAEQDTVVPLENVS